MKQLKGAEIRAMWLKFFSSKGHEIIPSASLIPVGDPTLLWINAGVAPLKKYFDGREIPTNRRMTNAQKSIRTNDIDNVGKTARHHTFFEMLGNFSVGDYFRPEALKWAVELLTSPEWFGFPMEKLYFTVYTDDAESKRIWMENGVPEDHIIPLEGNFWEIGEGPCGPDSEIFFDRGEKYDPNHIGIKLLAEDMENDRYIEIWNIVFSQYNAEKGKDRKDYKELPAKNIDTGSGLERLACVMQGVDTNYDTDLFMPIIHATEKLTGKTYQGQMAFKVIADHLRSVTFALADGATFSNEGRGYVLRRLVRRAERYGRELGMQDAFLYILVSVVVEIMKEYYPYLIPQQARIEEAIKKEEEKFLRTIDAGEKRLTEYVQSGAKTIPAEVAFQLYDTFGYPIELTQEAAEEQGLSVDIEGFKKYLALQKERARAARGDQQSMGSQHADYLAFNDNVKFVGYETLENVSQVIAIFKDGERVKEATGKVSVVTRETPFYGEAGGEVGDKGVIEVNGALYPVLDTQKMPRKQNVMLIDMGEDTLSEGMEVALKVDKDTRKNISANHSATHLVNLALRTLISKDIFQHGSFVSDEGLHFDFNYDTVLTNEQLCAIEDFTKKAIAKGDDANIQLLAIDEAKKLGAQMVFTEKYGDIVRVVTLGDSTEFCGGCHVANTKEIGDFVVLGVENKGSGIYRLTAVAGTHAHVAYEEALAPLLKEENELLSKLQSYGAKALECVLDNHLSYHNIVLLKAYNASLKEQVKVAQKEAEKKAAEANKLDPKDFVGLITEGAFGKVLIQVLKNVPNNAARDLMDTLASQQELVIFFVDECSDKTMVMAKSSNKNVLAGNIIKIAATAAGGKGGGKPDFAQGAIPSGSSDKALEAVKKELGL